VGYSGGAGTGFYHPDSNPEEASLVQAILIATEFNNPNTNGGFS